MDNIISRFPGLAARIFDSLDDENLVKSKTVSRSWSEFTDNEVFFFRRIIKKLIVDYEDFKETWKLVMKKADIEMLKELSYAVKDFLSNHPENCTHENCNHRAFSYSPLHICAESGQVSLCGFILKITKDKNPKLKNGDIGWTPLHEAAQCGHLQICSMIMNKIEDNHPRDAFGYTLLHAAARGGHLETFKMIMNKVTDINPGDNEGRTPLHEAASEGHKELCKFIVDKVGDKNPADVNGWTPLHAAAKHGHKEMCKFIADKVEDKNPECNYGWTPKDLMWDNICGIDE